MAAPLPDNSFNGTLFAAYERCRALEAAASVIHSSRLTPLLGGRTLGYMLIHAPIEEGRTNVQEEIESCATDAKLMDLAQLYVDQFIRIFKSPKGRTPDTSSHSSRTSSDIDQQETQVLLEEMPRKHRTAKELALRRDDHRCLVTGKLDRNEHKRRKAKDPSFQAPWTYTQTWHILPDCLNQDLELSPKAGYSALRCFGRVNVIADNLNGPVIHRIDNIMTLDISVNTAFDELDLWLEPEGDIPNRYRICSLDRPSIDIPTPPIVTFTSTDPKLPVPNACFLKLHAAWAKIAGLSGASQYVERTLHDMEEMKVLAGDGTSADVLGFALARIQVH
ncbi:hypothetical protein FRB94_001594 [Tulasnella sp. JGI-2019a]|nr:hypothetical protein FRB94_001594 [Tulasnella sp. JGI-2019a]